MNPEQGGTPSNPPCSRTTEELLESLFVQGLTPDSWEVLAGQLQSDPGAMRRYIETIHLCQMVSDRSAPNGGSVTPFKSPAESEPQPTATGSSPAESHGARPSASPSLDVSKGARDSHTWRWVVGAASLAASLAFVLGVYSRSWLETETAESAGPTLVAESTPFGGANGVVAQPESASAWNASFAQRDRLALVTGLTPAASADGLLRSMQVGDSLRCGEVVQLTEGVMRIELASGAEMLLEGPAEYSIVGSSAVFLRLGRLHMTGSGDCVVQTPLITVEGHHAELAVTAQRDELATAYTYRGEVRVHSNSWTNHPGSLIRTLASGKGLSAQPNPTPRQLATTTVEAPTDLPRSWAEVERQLHPYERMVLAKDPLAYWPLHHVRRNRRVLDLTQHGFDGQAIGNWPVELADSQPHRGAAFDGESYIEPDRKPPIDVKRGFTIESWAKVTGGPEYQSVFTSRWVFASNTPSQQCFGFTLYAGDDDHWEFWSGSGEYGKNWQQLVGMAPVDRGRWTHVSATFTPKRIVDGEYVDGDVQLYVDGQLVGEAVQSMSLMDFEWPARIGAAEFVPKSLTSWLFVGEIRDVAIYNFVMTPQQIQEHHAAGREAT